MATDNIISEATRLSLTNKYPNAYRDFYGSKTACIYKSGHSWPVRTGPEAQRIIREARPVYSHAIGPVWLSIGNLIYNYLDSIHVTWTSINPLAYADRGEAKPFCPLILSIGVMPSSLVYENAVVAADGVKAILAKANFPDIEVAFVESVVTRSATGPKLQSFDPLLDGVSEFRKPFTPTLGLSIAPLEFPYYEGTAALYFRVSKDDDRVALLTCAHVARPPPVYANTGLTHHGTQPREEITVLGDKGYNDALEAMKKEISKQRTMISIWGDTLDRLGDPVEGEVTKVTQRRGELMRMVARARRRVRRMNKLHSDLIKRYTTPLLRVIGFVLHSEPITVSVGPHQFTSDWALIELYNEKVDWSEFKGNKVYIGGNLSFADFHHLLFPHPTDQADYQYPEDGLLQAFGVVPDAELRNPQHLDVHGDKCMLVVKNGSATGTTVGRANGLESFKRTYEEHGIVTQTSIEIAVLPYDNKHGKFSDRGDSGSVVLARDGRIFGILTGGAGSTDEIDITFVTPYWWIEEQIKAKYPGACLY